MPPHGPPNAEPRRAIVTGGGSGIGRAICLELARAGWTVAVADIDAKAAEGTAQLAAPQAPPPAVLALDVTRADSWREAIQSLRSRWPGLDLLVNNAGVLHAGPLFQTPTADLRRVIDTNLLGAMLGCRTAGPWMTDSTTRDAGTTGRPGPAVRLAPQRGAINIASVFAQLAPPAFAAYSASKAGLVAFSEALRGEWRAAGLNVTVVLPGVVRTPLFTSCRTSPATLAGTLARYADAARLTPEEVARRALRAAADGRPVVVIGGRARRFAALKRWLPMLARRLVIGNARRELRLDSPSNLPPAADPLAED